MTASKKTVKVVVHCENTLNVSTERGTNLQLPGQRAKRNYEDSDAMLTEEEADKLQKLAAYQWLEKRKLVEMQRSELTKEASQPRHLRHRNK